MSTLDVSPGASVGSARHPSWRHQQAALAWAEELIAAGHHGLMIAMAMGTGKSKVAIELISRLGPRTILIACPLRVVDVWRCELEKHAQFPYVVRLLDESAGTINEKVRSAREALTLARVARTPLILVINYESLWQEPFGPWALANVWGMVIGDEIHRAKDPNGRLSRFLGRLSARAQFRLGLTGTPMPHSPLDVWAEYRFLDPTIYDETFFSFKTRYAVWGGYDRRQVVDWRDIDDLRRRFYSIAFRVEKTEALDLPPQMDQVLWGELSGEARRLYRQLDQEFITWLKETPESQLTIKNALVLLVRLAQLTGGTLKDDAKQEHVVDRAKENLFADLLEDLAPGEPVVAFARFKADLDAMARAATKVGRTWVEVSGRSPDGIARWKNREADILLAQIQAAGEGQDFTRARVAVFFSIGFSLAHYLQARDRIHRPGQTWPVVYYHLMLRDTIDEHIQRAIENRRQLVESVLKEMKQRVPRFAQ